MMTKQNEPNIQDQKPDPVPNENGGFYFSSFVKIIDPNSKEVLVETRGDN